MSTDTITADAVTMAWFKEQFEKAEAPQPLLGFDWMGFRLVVDEAVPPDTILVSKTVLAQHPFGHINVVIKL